MQITAIKKPTTARFFKDFKIGTRFSINMQIIKPGRGRGLYASYVEITNHTTSTSTTRSITDLVNRLDIFDFLECTDYF